MATGARLCGSSARPCRRVEPATAYKILSWVGGSVGDLEVCCDCCGLRFVVGEFFAFLAVGEEAQRFACGEKGTEGVGHVFVVAHDVV